MDDFLCQECFIPVFIIIMYDFEMLFNNISSPTSKRNSGRRGLIVAVCSNRKSDN